MTPDPSVGSFLGAGRRTASAVLAIGLVVSALLSLGMFLRERSLARARFQERASDIVLRVEQSVNTPLEHLHATASLMRAQPNLDLEVFRQFARPLLARHKSLAALEWAEVVERSEREAFERRLTLQRGHPVEIREPGPNGSMVRAPERDVYLVITLMEPWLPELEGFDVRYEPVRQRSVDAALAADGVHATSKFTLVEDPPGVYSVAVYEPIVDEASAERRVKGTGIALYRVDPLVRAALPVGDGAAPDLALIDDDASLSESDRLLFASRPGSEAPGSGYFAHSQRIGFAGRSWSVVVSQPARIDTGTVWAVGLGSVCLSALVALYLGNAVATRKLRERVVALASLGEYTLGRELGAGGMGTVFEATHRALRRRAAIKLIHADKVNPEMIERFAREAKTTSELTHPNTVTLFDYGRTQDGRFYLVMEYVEGLTFETLIKKFGPQSEARVRHALIQVCHALTEAHERSVIHRDIKPANLMLCVYGGVHDFVKVLDFGLAKDEKRHDGAISAANLVVGTTAYIAPEVLVDPTRAGVGSDLYAVGCVAYYLLTGKEVFAKPSELAAIAAHLTLPPPPMPSISEAFERIVQKCLSKKPEDRYASARPLARALSNLDLPPWSEVEASDWWAEHHIEPVPPSITMRRRVRPVAG
jgi:CHASE1-domain containing sensor protein